MSVMTKSILWTTAMMLVAFAGSMHWLDKALAWTLIGTLPCFAVIHIGVAVKRQRRCASMGQN